MLEERGHVGAASIDKPISEQHCVRRSRRFLHHSQPAAVDASLLAFAFTFAFLGGLCSFLLSSNVCAPLPLNQFGCSVARESIHACLLLSCCSCSERSLMRDACLLHGRNLGAQCLHTPVHVTHMFARYHVRSPCQWKQSMQSACDSIYATTLDCGCLMLAQLWTMMHNAPHT